MSKTSVRIISIHFSTVALAATFLTGVIFRAPFGTSARRAVIAALIGWLVGGILGKAWILLTHLAEEEEGPVLSEVMPGGIGQTDEHPTDPS